METLSVLEGEVWERNRGKSQYAEGAVEQSNGLYENVQGPS